MGVHAGYVVAEGVTAVPGLAIVEIPPIPEAATLIHEGHYETIAGSWDALNDWADRNGWIAAGPTREVYLVTMPHPIDELRTELQLPVRRAG